jgi:hypothetical protein
LTLKSKITLQLLYIHALRGRIPAIHIFILVGKLVLNMRVLNYAYNDTALYFEHNITLHKLIILKRKIYFTFNTLYSYNECGYYILITSMLSF